MREEKIVEKLKDRENSIYKKKQQDPVESFYPRLEDSKLPDKQCTVFDL